MENKTWYSESVGRYVTEDWHVPCEIELTHVDSFLKIKETLTRIGIGNREQKTLYQSCHILSKQGAYYVMSFKELFALDGKCHSISVEDLQRRNTIANLLAQWNLCTLKNPDNRLIPVSSMVVIPHKDKSDWTLVAKYQVGQKQHKKV